MTLRTRILPALVLPALVASGPALAQQAPGGSGGDLPCSHILAMTADDAERVLYFLQGHQAGQQAQPGRSETAGEAAAADDPRLDPRLTQLMPAQAIGFAEIPIEEVRAACEEDPDRSAAEILAEHAATGAERPAEAPSAGAVDTDPDAADEAPEGEGVDTGYPEAEADEGEADEGEADEENEGSDG